ncbi:hypothetical protein GCM10007891_05130 [Methylophaga thalassica]|uniref:Uncharacterized protein n=1 Tax=Methylophaga thalassica TaxID=40223 RepID=A0ABQ5TSZ5_9GAMM|nr:hypothetical protein [Methylophaga thalassica]GLP98659.1 hypothetical protein GCM10007891_05130 [Methylophaga thalassica]
MKTDKQNPPPLKICQFRHTHEVLDLVIEITQVENIDFATLMRQLINAGLESSRGVKIMGNRVIDRGSVKKPEQVSRAT